MTVRRVLVTGGAGFIGANLVRELAADDYDVTVVDDLSTGNSDYLEGCAVELVEGDVRDPALLQQVVPDRDAIIHLAAQSGVESSLADPLADCDINVTGTVKLLEAARAHGIRRFVFASSNAPLGRRGSSPSEDTVPLPVSPYGASKLAGEAYCLSYHGSWGLETVVLRFSNVYGPFSAHKTSVVARFLRDAAESGRMTVEGGGRALRDFLYVGDACRAAIRALGSDVAGEVFQIATGIGTTVSELAGLVAEVVGGDIRIQEAPARQGDAVGGPGQTAKARRSLGWESEVTLEAGIEKTWSWMQGWTIRSRR